MIMVRLDVDVSIGIGCFSVVNVVLYVGLMMIWCLLINCSDVVIVLVLDMMIGWIV